MSEGGGGGGGAQRRGARAEFQPDDSGRLGLLKKATNFKLLLASYYIRTLMSLINVGS